MRIAILITLAGLAACSREPANAVDASVDVSAMAANRAEANIDNYAAARAGPADRRRGPAH